MGERALQGARRTGRCGGFREQRSVGVPLSFFFLRLHFVAQSIDREDASDHRRHALTKIGAESESVSWLLIAGVTTLACESALRERDCFSTSPRVRGDASEARRGGLSAFLSAASLRPAGRPLTPNLSPQAGRGSAKCRCLTSWIDETRPGGETLTPASAYGFRRCAGWRWRDIPAIARR